MKKMLLLVVFIGLIGLSIAKLTPYTTKVQVQSDLNYIKEVVDTHPTQSPESTLPAYHLINTAFVPQAPEGNWDQPWQDTCEEASVLTGYYYYQKKKPSITDIKQAVLKMVDYEQSKSWQVDISLDQILVIATDYLDLRNSYIIDNPSLNDLKTEITKNHPIVVPASGKILFKENKNFRQGGPYYHNLTILGFDDSTQQFIVHDVGTRKGAYFRYSYNLLLESIHDLPESKDKHDILQGSKRVLVLLQ